MEVKEISLYEMCPDCAKEGSKVGSVDETIYQEVTIFCQHYYCKHCKKTFMRRWDNLGGEWRT